MIIRFGHDWDPACMKQDEVLFNIQDKIKNFATIYLVDISKVSDFNKMYELYDPCTTMFFYRNKVNIYLCLSKLRIAGVPVYVLLTSLCRETHHASTD